MPPKRAGPSGGKKRKADDADTTVGAPCANGDSKKGKKQATERKDGTDEGDEAHGPAVEVKASIPVVAARKAKVSATSHQVPASSSAVDRPKAVSGPQAGAAASTAGRTIANNAPPLFAPVAQSLRVPLALAVPGPLNAYRDGAASERREREDKERATWRMTAAKYAVAVAFVLLSLAWMGRALMRWSALPPAQRRLPPPQAVAAKTGPLASTLTQPHAKAQAQAALDAVAAAAAAAKERDEAARLKRDIEEERERGRRYVAAEKEKVEKAEKAENAEKAAQERAKEREKERARAQEEAERKKEREHLDRQKLDKERAAASEAHVKDNARHRVLTAEQIPVAVPLPPSALFDDKRLAGAKFVLGARVTFANTSLSLFSSAAPSFEDMRRRDLAGKWTGSRVLSSLSGRARDLQLTSPPLQTSDGIISAVMARLDDAVFGGPAVVNNLFNVLRPPEPRSRYCFAGINGSLSIRLFANVDVHKVAIFHRPDEYASAPQHFQLLGWPSDPTHASWGVRWASNKAPKLLGVYQLQPARAETGKKHAAWELQSFEIAAGKRRKQGFRALTLQVLSNFGDREKTCLYRVQVFGEVADGAKK